jgi:hypothetical protein
MPDLPNGLGESTGAGWANAKPVNLSGTAYYVDSATGNNSYDGTSRLAPVATLAQAVSDASSGDVIVLMDGHTETLTAVLNINKNLTIVGGGRTDGKPTVKFTMNNAANAIMFNITGTGTPAYVRLHNVWIEENLQANTGARIASTCDTLFHMSSCYFECGQHDDGAALLLESSAGTALIENTTFISTATLNSARPHSAIQTSGTIYSVIMNGVIVDGGTVGFAEQYPVDLDDNAATDVFAISCSLLRGADMQASPTAGTSSFINAQTTSGAVVVTGT